MAIANFIFFKRNLFFNLPYSNQVPEDSSAYRTYRACRECKTSLEHQVQKVYAETEEYPQVASKDNLGNLDILDWTVDLDQKDRIKGDSDLPGFNGLPGPKGERGECGEPGPPDSYGPRVSYKILATDTIHATAFSYA